MKTVDYVSDKISVHIPVKGLYDELKMACVAYSILGIEGKKDAEALLTLLEIIMED
jgi:hypothetical protein